MSISNLLATTSAPFLDVKCDTLAAKGLITGGSVTITGDFTGNEISVVSVVADTASVGVISSASITNTADINTDELNCATINLTASAGTPQPLVDCSYEAIGAVPLTGAATTSVEIDFSRISKNVTLGFSAVLVPAAANDALNGAAGAIPLAYRPERDYTFSIFVVNNSALVAGSLVVGANGSLLFRVGAATAYQNAGNCGFNAFSVSYPTTIA